MTGIDKTNFDIGRRELTFNDYEVKNVLPEWFAEYNPDMQVLLDKYHDFLDSEGGPYAFSHKIKGLPRVRDIGQTDEENLTLIEDELLLGDNYLEGILDKRTGAELANNYYRSKGTKFGIERFFRSFFAVDPQVVYGKDLILTVGDPLSIIGPESPKVIMDAKVNQFWGILIRIGLPQSEWEFLYKLFAHPGGMFFAGEIQIELVNLNLNFNEMPISIPPRVPDVVFGEAVQLVPRLLSEPTLIIDGDSSEQYRLKLWDTAYGSGAGPNLLQYTEQLISDSSLETVIGELAASTKDTNDGVIYEFLGTKVMGTNGDRFYLRGDIDQDGSITASDALLMQQYNRGLLTDSVTNSLAAGVLPTDAKGEYRSRIETNILAFTHKDSADLMGELNYLQNTYASIIDITRAVSPRMDESDQTNIGAVNMDANKIKFDNAEFSSRAFKHDSN